jgi:hypothetical protein
LASRYPLTTGLRIRLKAEEMMPANHGVLLLAIAYVSD